MTPACPDSRLVELQAWCSQLTLPDAPDPHSLVPVTGDASFRRYFRAQTPEGSRIIMDAPPTQEDSAAFVQVAGLLARCGLRVPEIRAIDAARGFLLLTDLGARSYLDAIRHGLPDPALQTHYRAALQLLVRLQRCPAESLAPYDAARLREELAVFPQWYLHTHLGVVPDDATQALLADLFQQLAQRAAAQPRVFVHRDFHSPNLMLPRSPDDAPGLIDFQDALYGPLSYDIASLVMDARTRWPEAQQLDWAIRYWEAARADGLPVPADFAQFHAEYEWMSLQRNLRILGVFARLSHRDGKHGYLAHLPIVLAYVRQVATRYREFLPLARLLDRLDHEPSLERSAS